MNEWMRIYFPIPLKRSKMRFKGGGMEHRSSHCLHPHSLEMVWLTLNSNCWRNRWSAGCGWARGRVCLDRHNIYLGHTLTHIVFGGADQTSTQQDTRPEVLWWWWKIWKLWWANRKCSTRLRYLGSGGDGRRGSSAIWNVRWRKTRTVFLKSGSGEL